MYLPRSLLAHLYTHLTTTHNATQPPLLIITALTVDALCAVRILTTLLKRDFIPHTVVPVSGYADLQDAGERLLRPLLRPNGGDGGRVVCIGCGGGVDLNEVLLGFDGEEDGQPEAGHGLEIWVVDARRPWNLENVFGSGEGRGVQQGKVLESYRSGRGGVIVWCDGDIELELEAEREAYFGLKHMPEITEDDLALEGAASDDGDAEDGARDENEDGEPSSSQTKRKRRSETDDEDDYADSEDERPRQKRRSNESTPIPSSPGGNPRSNQLATSPPTQSPSAAVPSSPPPTKTLSLRQQKRALLKLRRTHEATLEKYYDAGSHLSEPVSSMLYSLASDLGREDNELLWLAIVGVESISLSPFFSTTQSTRNNTHTSGLGRRSLDRLDMVKHLLRDEVRRLNPPSLNLQSQQGDSSDAIPTHARSPTDTSIRLSPEPRFLLIRHWSLHDSMLHSPYLATRLHVWSEQGRKRLHKLLAKMGISLSEANKGYLHLDMEIKRSLNRRLVKFAEQYNLEGLVPGEDNGVGGKGGWGFVRSWGWRGTLSAVDVATVVSAILEVGADAQHQQDTSLGRWDSQKHAPSYNHQRIHQQQHRGLPSPPHSSDSGTDDQTQPQTTGEPPDWTTARFFAAFDALAPSTSSHSTGLPTLLKHIPAAQNLARAILRTGSALVSKHQIRHLRAFRMGVVREGPDVGVFTHPGALVKLGAWVAEAVGVLEAEKGVGVKGGKGKGGRGGEQEALVLAALDEGRGVYVVVGLGGGSVAGQGGRVRGKKEMKEREERRKRRVGEKARVKAEKARKREERRVLRRERLAANGDLDSDVDDAEGEESDATESSASSSSPSDSDSDSADSDSDAGSATEHTTRPTKRRVGRNRFPQAFQHVVEETGARVRIDSFEHSVVEVRKEDLAGFLEALSLRSVIG